MIIRESDAILMSIVSYTRGCNHDLFRELEHYYEEIKGEDDSIRSLYTGLFRKWKEDGKIRDDIDDELLPAFLDSLAYIDDTRKR
ncbi:hypothetical protein ABE142_00915 [Paenibacillus alvei]|uniref:hypothetical protein n=1 Tax=Paenibacillus alvei TaxID=44250 RepID=UPI001F5150EF|nr:hypothetical protein [Paenibacillus alvei]